MKILLISNYPGDEQFSMLQFADLLEGELKKREIEVARIEPREFFGKFKKGRRTGKWLGYIDKYILFLVSLRRYLRNIDETSVIHICDHSNAIYLNFLNFGSRLLVTCHDLMAIDSMLGRFPQNSLRLSGRALQKLILRGVRRGVHFVCDSVSTQRDLLSTLDRNEEKVQTIYIGINESFRLLPDDEARELLVDLNLPEEGRYVLHVGNDSWYKNRDGALRIFSRTMKRANEESLFLLFVGPKLSAGQRRIVAEENLEGKVIEMGRIDRRRLVALYNLSEALLFPSFYEGFGWPPIEAQACGCPVVAGRGGALFEVVGESGLTADAEDEDILSQHLVSIVESPDLRSEVVRRGFENVERFKTKTMIDRYIEVYETILAG